MTHNDSTSASQCIILLIDACPVAFLGCYGAEWPETPSIDELAHGGRVFDRHYAESLTPNDAANSIRSLLGELSGHSLTTAAISCNAAENDDRDDEAKQIAIDLNRTAIEKTLHEALDWIEPRCDQPFVIEVLLNLANCLPPQLFRTEEREASGIDPLFPSGPVSRQELDDESVLPQLRAGWSARIAFLDAAIGDFIAGLRDLDIWNRATVILTAERGVHLGEQGYFGAVASPYDAAIHLPLIIKGLDTGPSRVLHLTQPADLLAEIANLFALDRNSAPLPSVAKTAVTSNDQMAFAVHSTRWKLVVPFHHHDRNGLPFSDFEFHPTAELFAKPEDRFDVRDVARQHPEIVAILLAHVSSARSPDSAG